jgi:hypothetical protein
MKEEKIPIGKLFIIISIIPVLAIIMLLVIIISEQTDKAHYSFETTVEVVEIVKSDTENDYMKCKVVNINKTDWQIKHSTESKIKKNNIICVRDKSQHNNRVEPIGTQFNILIYQGNKDFVNVGNTNYEYFK